MAVLKLRSVVQLYKKKVMIENGIWISIDFICRIDFYMCVLLFTGQRFKAVCN